MARTDRVSPPKWSIKASVRRRSLRAEKTEFWRGQRARTRALLTVGEEPPPSKGYHSVYWDLA